MLGIELGSILYWPQAKQMPYYCGIAPVPDILLFLWLVIYAFLYNLWPFIYTFGVCLLWSSFCISLLSIFDENGILFICSSTSIYVFLILTFNRWLMVNCIFFQSVGFFAFWSLFLLSYRSFLIIPFVYLCVCLLGQCIDFLKVLLVWSVEFFLYFPQCNLWMDSDLILNSSIHFYLILVNSVKKDAESILGCYHQPVFLYHLLKQLFFCSISYLCPFIKN